MEVCWFQRLGASRIMFDSWGRITPAILHGYTQISCGLVNYRGTGSQELKLDSRKAENGEFRSS